MLQLLRAKSGAYDAAQRVYRSQFVTAVCVPLALTLLKLLVPSVSSWIGVLGVLLLMIDVLWLDPRQKRHKRAGAAIQERFDCYVLGIPERPDRNGEPPSPEAISEYAAQHPSTMELRDWYAPEIVALPPLPAAVACQRTNGYWNSTMRSRFAGHLRAISVIVPVLVILITVIRDDSARITAMWLGILLPLVTWTTREGERQREAAAGSVKTLRRAEKLWTRLNAGEVDAQIAPEVRELQNDIYDQRHRDPQVFAWVYDRYRARDEAGMKVGIAALVDDYFAKSRKTPIH